MRTCLAQSASPSWPSKTNLWIKKIEEEREDEDRWSEVQEKKRDRPIERKKMKNRLIFFFHLNNIYKKVSVYCILDPIDNDDRIFVTSILDLARVHTCVNFRSASRENNGEGYAWWIFSNSYWDKFLYKNLA